MKELLGTEPSLMLWRWEMPQPPENANLRDRQGRTPIIYCAMEGRAELAKPLIAAGADVDAQDSNGEAALHFAAREHHPAMVELLLRSGANVDARDNDGNTPLGRAVFASRGRGEVIALLKAAGASRASKNKHGVSPSELASMIANFDVKQFLD